MIAFFDTSVHIAILRGTLAADEALRRVAYAAIRLSPVVVSELLRGSKGRARRSVDRLVAQLVPLEPPSWRRAWIDAGKLMPSVFPDHDAVGLTRLQNDLLLALTARYTGAMLLATDRHFATIRRLVPFELEVMG
jgi:predicted nucleic acid-binding protein